jgi:phospholipid N-methyltransferase
MFRAARLFIGQIVGAPRAVGAVLPSSRALGEAMVEPIDFAQARVIVEFGAGTGALTRAIAARLRPGQRYLGIELNAAFVEHLRGEFPNLTFVAASVENLDAILAEHGIEAIDAIICGLPWASLPVTVQERAFGHVGRFLVPGGLFITFAYLQGLPLPAARALRQRLGAMFSKISRTRIIWGNVPPAFAYVCRK